MKRKIYIFLLIMSSMIVATGSLLHAQQGMPVFPFRGDSLVNQLAIYAGSGEENNKIVPTTPEAAALIKLTEYPVSMTTGVPDVGIPLFEAKAGNLTMPLTLQYHAGGFKINEQATRVGLGWSLSTDLQVTRTINGKDDFFNTGYINNGLRSTIPYPFYNSSSPGFPSQNMYNMASGQIDGLPDKFSYKLLNKSGSFFFWQNNAGTYTFVPVPYDNIKIIFTNDQFVITDTDGTVYYFSEKEFTGDVITSTGTCTNCHVTAWKCTKIVSNLGVEEFTFSYTPQAIRSYQTKTDGIEKYSSYYYRGSLDFGSYYRSDLNPFSQQSIYNPSLYPLFRVSNPKYIEYFANGQAPILHVPYYDSSQRKLIDKTYTCNNSFGAINNPYNSSCNIQGLSVSRINFRGGYITFDNPDKLTQINIKDVNDVTVKTIKFSYSYQAPINLQTAKLYNGSNFQGTMYLESVSLGNGNQNYETYGLIYNNKYCFGNHLLGHDAWGYPNEYTREISSSSFYTLPGKTMNETYYLDLLGWAQSKIENVPLQLNGDDWALAPKEQYMRYGVLKRIVYPTGGVVDFDFEANKHKGFNYYIDHSGEGTIACKPHQLAGGLRIRSINFYDPGESRPSTQKYYRYGENEDGAGDLLYPPEIDSSGKTYKVGAVDVNKYVVYLKGDFPSGGVNTRNMYQPLSVERQTTYLPASILDYTYENGSSVYYSTVTEYNRDYGSQTGKKVYRYYSPKDFIPAWNASVRVPETLISYIKTNAFSGAQKSYCEYKFTTNREYELSLEKTFSYTTYKKGDLQAAYADYRILYNVVSGPGLSTSMDYYNDRYSSAAQSAGLDGSDFIYGSYLIPVTKLLLSSETDDVYENSQKMTQTITYTYNNLQPSKIETTNSKNERTSKSLKYSYDFNGIYDTMESKNMISQVIEEKQRNETNGIDVYVRKNNYGIKTDAGGILPVSTEMTYGSSASVIETTFDLYDQYGNILQMVGKDKKTVSYLWGYKGLYPVAALDGVTYSEIPSGFKSNATINNPGSDASLRTVLTDLRNSISGTKLVTGYTYKYLTGVTSISQPNGSWEYYNYDPYGRLTSVLDNNQKTKEAYAYNTVFSLQYASGLMSVNTPVMQTLSMICGGYNRSYNAIMLGGTTTGMSVELANETAENAISNNQGIPLQPNCSSPLPTVQMKITGICSRNYSTSIPARVDVDLIQDGKIIYTKKVPMNRIEDSGSTSEYFNIPPGEYKISIRSTAENRYQSNGLLIYNFRDTGDTAHPDGVRIDSPATVTLASNRQYEINIWPVELF